MNKGPVLLCRLTTARVHDLTLVTRYAADFEASVESILNPFRI